MVNLRKLIPMTDVRMYSSKINKLKKKQTLGIAAKEITYKKKKNRMIRLTESNI